MVSINNDVDKNNSDQDSTTTIVRLYQPIVIGRKPNIENTTISFIGGSVRNDNEYKCSVCFNPLNLLVQLHAPEQSKNNTFQVFACNNNACIRTLFSNNNTTTKSNGTQQQNEDNIIDEFFINRLCYGGQGIFKCIKVTNNDTSTGILSDVIDNIGQPVLVEEDHTTKTLSVTNVVTGWDDNNDNNDNNYENDDYDWNISIKDNSNNITMKEVDIENNDVDTDLATKLAQLETSTASIVPRKYNNQQPKTKDNVSNRTTTATSTATLDTNCFPVYALQCINEPEAKAQQLLKQQNNEFDNDDDDHDDNIAGTVAVASDEKIQNMLARYLKDEDDTFILDALQAASATGSTGSRQPKSNNKNNNKNKKTNDFLEKDERLSVEDRALLIYTDRIKRNTKQVLRYQYNGIPLWSIPVYTPTQWEQRKKQVQSKLKKQQQQQSPLSNTLLFGIEKSIPYCEQCSSKRIFVFQIVPSILHVLNVDQYVSCIPVPNQGTTGSSSNEINNNLQQLYNQGGMDFGNIAVYTCCNNQCQNTDQFCIIQDTLDTISPSATNNVAVTPATTVQDASSQKQQDWEQLSVDEDNDDDDDDTKCDNDTIMNDPDMDPKYFIQDDDDEDW